MPLVRRLIKSRLKFNKKKNNSHKTILCEFIKGMPKIKRVHIEASFARQLNAPYFDSIIASMREPITRCIGINVAHVCVPRIYNLTTPSNFAWRDAANASFVVNIPGGAYTGAELATQILRLMQNTVGSSVAGISVTYMNGNRSFIFSSTANWFGPESTVMTQNVRDITGINSYSGIAGRVFTSNAEATVEDMKSILVSSVALTSPMYVFSNIRPDQIQTIIARIPLNTSATSNQAVTPIHDSDYPMLTHDPNKVIRDIDLTLLTDLGQRFVNPLNATRSWSIDLEFILQD
jgi:hypothetical protein